MSRTSELTLFYISYPNSEQQFLILSCNCFFSVVVFQLCFVYIGLDLVEVGRDDVTLRLGKQAARRQLQFALQSLVAIFGNCLGYSQIL